MAIIISVLLHCLVFDYYNNVFINIFMNKVYFLKIDLAINTHTYICNFKKAILQNNHFPL